MSISGKLFAVAVAGVGLVALISRRDKVETFPISALVDPASVAGTAETLYSSSEDQFIQNAWHFVGDNFAYEKIGSDMMFDDNTVLCARCYLPTATLARGEGNCVAVAALLASLLRNALPPERVFMVVGDYDKDLAGIRGHAWVEVQRGGTWYLLEATSPPRGWFTVNSQAGLYVPFAYLNDQIFRCNNPELCLTSSGCRISARVLTERCKCG